MAGISKWIYVYQYLYIRVRNYHDLQCHLLSLLIVLMFISPLCSAHPCLGGVRTVCWCRMTAYWLCSISSDCAGVYVYISSNQAAGHGQSRIRHRGHGDSDAARCYDDSTLVNTSVETINQLLRLLLPGLQGTQSGRMIRTIFVSSSFEWIYILYSWKSVKV